MHGAPPLIRANIAVVNDETASRRCGYFENERVYLDIYHGSYMCAHTYVTTGNTQVLYH
jgi:hypothetical protein